MAVTAGSWLQVSAMCEFLTEKLDCLCTQLKPNPKVRAPAMLHFTIKQLH